jgi:hypothetical protein
VYPRYHSQGSEILKDDDIRKDALIDWGAKQKKKENPQVSEVSE